jgi:hypothetical protein
MKNCMLHYPMFRDIFPMWALAEYRRQIMLTPTAEFKMKRGAAHKRKSRINKGR